MGEAAGAELQRLSSHEAYVGGRQLVGAGKLVLPVLVEDADMPPASKMPPVLAPLARLNALRISDDRWDYDVGRLVARLEEVLPAVSTVSTPGPVGGATLARPALTATFPPPPSSGGRRWVVGAAVVVALVAFLIIAGVTFLGGDDGGEEPVATVQVTTSVTVAAITTTLSRVTTPTTTTTPAGETSITLSRSSGPAGTSMTVSGSGFGAGETVEIRFHVTQLATTTNRSGAFSNVVIKVPADAVKGFPFSVTATGRTTIKSARVPFTVT